MPVERLNLGWALSTTSFLMRFVNADQASRRTKLLCAAVLPTPFSYSQQGNRYALVAQCVWRLSRWQRGVNGEDVRLSEPHILPNRNQ